MKLKGGITRITWLMAMIGVVLALKEFSEIFFYDIHEIIFLIALIPIALFILFYQKKVQEKGVDETLSDTKNFLKHASRKPSHWALGVLAVSILLWGASYYISCERTKKQQQQTMANTAIITSSQLEGDYSFIDPHYTKPIPANVQLLNSGNFELSITNAYGRTKVSLQPI